MNVEFRDLQWALVAAQHRSLRQASEQLHVRQSTLSRRLQDLEHRLGAALFDRSNGGTRPTPAGQEFLEAARAIVEQTETVIARFVTQSRGTSGKLMIGTHASLSAGSLRATLVEYHQRYPDVDAHLIDGPSEHLLSDLASSAVDIAFIAGLGNRWDDKSLPVWSERAVLACPLNHPLQNRDIIHWSDLRHSRILLPQKGPGLEITRLLTNKLGWHDPCVFVRHDAGLDRLLTLVGAGWGLLVALEGATGISYPNIAFREIHDSDGPTRVHFQACWRQANENPTLAPFLELLHERYPDLSGSGAIV